MQSGNLSHAHLLAIAFTFTTCLLQETGLHRKLGHRWTDSVADDFCRNAKLGKSFFDQTSRKIDVALIRAVSMLID